MRDNTSVEHSTVRKMAWRLMPLFTVGYFLASLDRVNVGFAALQMNGDIGLSAAAYGLGAGLFFFAYCLFAVPCNMVMTKVGATRWLSAVMIAWGLLAAGMSMAQGPVSFYLLRFLLGIAEAGFFPGVIYYFTLCFPKRYRGQMVAILMMALPVSSVLGSPLSAALLNFDGLMNLRGWHWLFILEGAPAVALGFLTFLMLPRQPLEAKWLSPQESSWLRHTMAEEQKSTAPTTPRVSLFATLFSPRVLLLTLIYLGGTAVTNGLALWQPQIIKTFNLSVIQIGLVNAIPFAVASLAMYLWGRHSDQTGERRLHTAFPLLLGATGLAASMYVTHLWSMLMVLCLTITAASMIKGPFWAMATEMIPASAAAVVIGQINALNNLGVFVGTWLIGLIRTSTGSFTYALTPLMLVTSCACLGALLIGRRQSPRDPHKKPV
ncbi:MFS transporter [Pantoea sp. JZ2]|uniref:MFS transporter n=1 Tax=Pantoea sp. JZ2 TaxID=2654189 RepID=UPI002B49FD2B|nr:MFS transporter [Pantoea sp. JZ2]WRH13786.1 MFS transporter [Pantoea sp. JZ2]